MAYTRHNWQCGEIVTDNALNNLEDGIEQALACCESGGGLQPLMVRPVSISYQDTYHVVTMDTTWQQVYDAIAEYRPCYCAIHPDQICFVNSVDEFAPAMLPIFRTFEGEGAYGAGMVSANVFGMSFAELDADSPDSPLKIQSECIES